MNETTANTVALNNTIRNTEEALKSPPVAAPSKREQELAAKIERLERQLMAAKITIRALTNMFED